jgi:hypothetical protein
MSRQTPQPDQQESPERREFLKKCGEFAAITPPAITLLLSTSLTSPALAYSAGSGTEHGGNGPKIPPAKPPKLDKPKDKPKDKPGGH